uniref:Odorant receptor n=1 Tax=Glyphodes pyloalis TaxID=1242752 RepID=A0A6M3GXV4_GLYPY|nr:olfactory receptor [Glyphodes pyloalis]
MAFKQIDCFNNNQKFWKILGLCPENDVWPYYNYYSTFLILIAVILYDSLLTVNFFFLPRQLDIFIEEMLFYFMELAVTSKVFTFFFQRYKIKQILSTLESEIFQPSTDEGYDIINKAKKFNVRFWKTVTAVSITSHFTHVFGSFFVNLFLSVKLELPICSYSFLSEDTLQKWFYPLFFYQVLGMHIHMWCNVNIDTFFLGVMIFVIAQLDILDIELKRLTNNVHDDLDGDKILNNRLNEAVNHYCELVKFCYLVEDVFSVTLIIQFGMASCIICVCLFRFTLTATADYYVFLATYMFIMIIQIMLPCWFGTQIMDKSCLLASAIYSSDWTPRSKRFKTSLRILVERLNRPITIVGGKMFPLSLDTFTSIMNSAYSFFTLLRHMQTREG